MTRFPVFLLSSLLLWSSCDCVQHARGIVLDKETLHPLDSVQFAKERDTGDRLYPSITAADGIFEYSGISGGFRCPDPVLVFRRRGYKTMTKEIDLMGPDAQEIVVLLERE